MRNPGQAGAPAAPYSAAMSAVESAATAATRREQRLRRVLEYIETRLDEPLDTATLAGVAAFSRFHFHRQFAALAGCTARDYLAQARLRSAAWRLAYRPRQSVAQIALACGYGSPEAFARAFKAATGQTPSAFRRQPDWPTWQAREDALRHIRSPHMPNPPVPSAVRIVDFPATRIALLVHRGDPQRLGESIRRFIAWRRARHLPPSAAATYNLLYDDPAAVPADEFRLGLAVATTREITAADDGLVAAWIPAGRCAVLRHRGDDDGLGDTLRCLYADWLPDSGEALRDHPPFLQRLAAFPDVAADAASTDVFLPLR